GRKTLEAATGFEPADRRGAIPPLLPLQHAAPKKRKPANPDLESEFAGFCFVGCRFRSLSRDPYFLAFGGSKVWPPSAGCIRRILGSAFSRSLVNVCMR